MTTPASPIPDRLRFSRPLALAAILLSLLFRQSASLAAEKMAAHFINVGQADATLLEFPCGAILVDAGAQDDGHVQGLVNYLGRVFAARPDLNNTLESVLITHNHLDHTQALRAVVEHFHVKRYIDNGQLEGRGTENPRWVRAHAHADGRDIRTRAILDDEIPRGPGRHGLTDGDIDPVSCAQCDPRLVILSGQKTENPHWSQEDFDNKNNHSLVIRVDFGRASFLFTGDLEEPGIGVLLDEYGNSGDLDVDLWHVGHHGSHNATTAALLDAITPDMAVISMGEWNFGKGTRDHFTTWFYGHARKVAVDLLQTHLAAKRAQSIRVNIATGSQAFQGYKVTRRVYATGWDGTVVVSAGLDGRMTVRRVDPPMIAVLDTPVNPPGDFERGGMRLAGRNR